MSGSTGPRSFDDRSRLMRRGRGLHGELCGHDRIMLLTCEEQKVQCSTQRLLILGWIIAGVAGVLAAGNWVASRALSFSRSRRPLCQDGDTEIGTAENTQLPRQRRLSEEELALWRTRGREPADLPSMIADFDDGALHVYPDGRRVWRPRR